MVRVRKPKSCMLSYFNRNSILSVVLITVILFPFSNRVEAQCTCPVATFAPPVSYPLEYLNSNTGGQMVTADFNNDGKADVAALLSRDNPCRVTIFLSDSSGSFEPPITLDYDAEAIAVGDFNNDGNVDLVIGLGGDVTILHGDGTSHFGQPSVGSYGGEVMTLAVAVGDFNNDNKPDVFSKGYYNQAAYLGDGFGANQISSFFGAELGAHDNLLVADFNGDGNSDVLFNGGDSSGNASILFGDGMGHFNVWGGMALPDSLPNLGNMWDQHINLYSVGDYNGDGKLDIATAHVTINLGDGTGGFAPSQYHEIERGQSAFWDIKTADINGDGKLDLVVIGAGKVSVLLGNGDGSFGSSTPLPGADSFSGERLAIADFNGDGKPDIAALGSDGGDPGSALENPRLMVWLNSTYQTPVGMNSTVVVNNTTFTFDDVTAGGTTTVTPIDPDTVGQVPGGFAVSNSVAYEIATTATFTGSVTLAFKVPGPISQDDFNHLAILHNMNGTLVDVTASTPARDYANLTIYATTTSFSPFYLARRGPHIKTLFDQTKAYKSGSTIPVKLQVLNASNSNLSSSNTSLVTRDLRLMSGNTTAPILDSGNANPDYNFRYDPTLGGTGGGYIFNLSTKGLASGQYVLSFYVGSERSFFYTVKFEVK